MVHYHALLVVGLVPLYKKKNLFLSNWYEGDYMRSWGTKYVAGKKGMTQGGISGRHKEVIIY